MAQIYRGYDIHEESGSKTNEGWHVRFNGVWQFKSDTEEAAMKEIDRRKREAAKAGK